jgi:hypothetical protein
LRIHSVFSAALNAPFPFIFGIHQRFYEEYKPTIAGDTARVFLDQNSVDFGSRGPAPPLPEKRSRKLLAQLKLFVPKLLQSKDNEETSYQESAIREAFLKFFVAIFKDYKRYFWIHVFLARIMLFIAQLFSLSIVG